MFVAAWPAYHMRTHLLTVTIFCEKLKLEARYSELGVGMGTGYGLDDGGLRVRVPVQPSMCLLHTASCTKGIEVSPQGASN
jgi:hypothetical protein